MAGREANRDGTRAPRRTATDARVGRWRPVTILGAVGAAVTAGLAIWVAPFGEDGATEGSTGAAVEEFMHVHGLEVPAWADGAAFVSTHQGTFRIVNGQWEWVSEEPHDFMGFAAHPTDEGVFFSSGHPAPGSGLQNPIGVMVSVDGGASWQPRALHGEVDFHAMAVHVQDGTVIYGYDGRQGLMRSVDEGVDWEPLDARDLDEAGGALSLAVGPSAPDDVLAGTETGLLRSTDAGGSWDILLDAPITAVAVDASAPSRLAAYAADGQGVILSEDAGQTWESLDLFLEDDVVGHLAIDPGDPDVVWLGTWGEELWRTSDGGRQWDQLAEAGRPTD